MILPVNNAISQPIAYAGGQPSTAKPSFGNALQATMAQLQATNHGTNALFHHKHDQSGTTNQSQSPSQSPFAAAAGAVSGLTMPAL
ncbi:MAG: hypothetical protein PHI71_14220 [Acidiphilium sp.]|jgi:hypothetical protein|uniref:Uncharacterized protein n=1 Tax=Acidiphilium acidophilum TaxID=76588 RepID=A0AAW9DQM0_ACIAO|nr:hypothetical protein [Acidiphilium acidophilum]MDD2862204.1 hypothetical protein [Acidiphilium sp.]MDX5931191.1 hypothetical protein [Acidiphilium acidophilum]